MNDKVYLIPGRNEKLSGFFGDTVSHMGFDVYGREILPPFSQLQFGEQLAIIKNDLKSLFWYAGAKLIGYSYGGYLLLHSLAELEPFPGKILLLSPVLGAAMSKDKKYSSFPPRFKKLSQLAENGGFPPPCYLELHTGAEDDGCDPDLANRICSKIENSNIKIVMNQAHRLDPAYVADVLSRYLGL